MAQWTKIQIKRGNGETTEAQAPIIISASRSTDVPAFYSDWFFHRLKVGYSAWTNPFNGTKSYVSYKNTRFIVFWSKNPKPLLGHLDELKDRNIGCYIQYTLNDYEKEGGDKDGEKLLVWHGAGSRQRHPAERNTIRHQKEGQPRQRPAAVLRLHPK